MIAEFTWFIIAIQSSVSSDMVMFKGVFRGGGLGGSNPPPQNFQIFFLKSEGKEIERKRKKGMLVGGGGVTS